MNRALWREASTLIIVARSSSIKNFQNNLVNTANDFKFVTKCDQPADEIDHRILMVKRNAKSSFMASAYVFPGGRVDLFDFSPKWWTLFDKLGFQQETLINQIKSRVRGPRPPMITSPITLSQSELTSDDLDDNFLIPDIALRIAAIRETFEETGVPILINPKENSSQDNIGPDKFSKELIDWRQRVRQDGSAFFDLCSNLNLLPNIWSLYEWWNWSTPKAEGPKRFDTMFYICFLENQPPVILDNAEVVKLKWTIPSIILEQHLKEKLYLAPPQIIELARIANFRQIDKLKEFASSREKEGVERWLPVVIKDGDMIRALLPGDDQFPDDPEVDLNSLDEIDYQSATRLNRIERNGASFNYLLKNHPDYGHFKPIIPLITK